MSENVFIKVGQFTGAPEIVDECEVGAIKYTRQSDLRDRIIKAFSQGDREIFRVDDIIEAIDGVFSINR